MIPYGDSLRTRTFPFVNYALILVNIGVFLYELSLRSQRLGPLRSSPTELDRFIVEWGMTPCTLLSSCAGPAGRAAEAFSGGPSPWLHLITAQFLHAGWVHIAGNMLFLWTFGDNIEDATGHLRYLVFYLIGGCIAGLVQVASDANGVAPSIGASGAIAAVLGAYLITYPRASVRVVIPIIIIPFFARVPAVLLMLVWFALQVMSVGSVSSAGDNVAYWAHIGGFIAGLVLVGFFRQGGSAPRAPALPV